MKQQTIQTSALGETRSIRIKRSEKYSASQQTNRPRLLSQKSHTKHTSNDKNGQFIEKN